MIKKIRRLFALEDYSTSADIDPKTFKNILMQATFLPIFLSVLLSVLFIIQVNKVLDQNTKVRYSDQTLALSAKSLRLIIDSETGVRGFLLRGQEIYLEPWVMANEQFESVFAQLQQITAENKDQTKALTDISSWYHEWLTEAKKLIASKRLNAENFVLKNSEPGLLRSKTLMDRIRERFDHLIQIEQKARLENWQNAESAIKKAIILILIFCFGIGISLSIISLRNLKSLSANYSTTVEALKLATDHLEDEVKTRTRELSESNQELEAFSYSVSHDLRAPLRGIDGFSQILIQDYSSRLDAESLRYLNFIRQGVQKMGILIDDLLNLSRLTRSEFRQEEVNIAQLAQETFDELQLSEPDRKVEFINHFSPETTPGDLGLLRVAFSNLLSNAWKYTKNNPKPKIELGQIKKDEKNIYFIKDNGVGFDMKYYNKLFQAFQRLHPKDQFNGTGIGLATVGRVIRRHNGKIWAEAEVNQGATFFFTLGL